MEKPLLTLLLSLSLVSGLSAADREAKVRNDLATVGQDTTWIYNDLAAGFAKAKEEGKPLLVVLRCVP